MYYLLASVLVLILGVLTGMLFAQLGLHDTTGIIASAIAGFVIVAFVILSFLHLSSK